jgi:chromosome segregation ATPase
METLKNGDKRLISYAVDLGTRITTNIDSRDDLVREIRVRRGVMTTRTARVETKVYTMRNVDPRVKTVVVDHPLRPEYKLTAGKPIETTSSHHRFEVRLAAGATEKFAVSEEYVYEQSTAVSSYTPDTLFQLTQNKALSAQGKAQLDAVLAKKREVAANDGQLADAERRLAEFSRDQERIRQNIASLNSVAGQQQQVQKYAAQLADTETRIAALRDQASELRKKKSALETELKALIDRLDF